MSTKLEEDPEFALRANSRLNAALGITEMNLYETVVLIAVSAGLGVSYGAFQSGGVPWLALVGALLVGSAVFVLLHRTTSKVHSERMLTVMYFVSPVAVFVATVGSAWGIHVVAR